MNRRSALATGSAMLSTALAGCAALGSDTNSGPAPFRLGHIQLENTLQTAQSIGLRVTRGDERVHEQTYQLEAAPDDGVTTMYAPTDDFGCQQGSYTVSTRLNEGNRTQVEIPAQYHGHLIELAVEEHGDGPALSHKVETKEPRQRCEEPTAQS